ncbi:hypothetical protein RDV84_23735 [Lysobacter yananisis]|uniref:Uncharacterized protein n=1 Tax=Lysobacter yananisis TaxID=1003114 RepID=A0ABY9PAR5_9GAMM|nr:hypothetical protein [Lysobacter yananisis]WMT02937.1 hypothetical protein RDV84_23735 [Lysobacter yananisis]
MSLTPLTQIATSLLTSGMLYDDDISLHDHRVRLRMALVLAKELIDASETKSAGGQTTNPAPTPAPAPAPSLKPKTTDTKNGVQVSVVARGISDERRDELRRALPINDPQIDTDPQEDTTPNSTKDAPPPGTVPRPKVH